MITLPTWLAWVGFIVGPGSLLVTAYIVFTNQKRDVTSTIDQKNIASQKEYISTLEKEKIRLEGEVKVRDEQIANLKKMIDAQKSDFQRQIDTLNTQIIEIKNSNTEITGIAETLKLFVPLTNDVKEFHNADQEIIGKLDMIIDFYKIRRSKKSATLVKG